MLRHAQRSDGGILALKYSPALRTVVGMGGGRAGGGQLSLGVVKHNWILWPDLCARQNFCPNAESAAAAMATAQRDDAAKTISVHCYLRTLRAQIKNKELSQENN